MKRALPTPPRLLALISSSPPVLLLLLLDVVADNKYIVYNTSADVVAGKLNVHVVPHTHDDIGWLETVDQYYIGSNNSIQVPCLPEQELGRRFSTMRDRISIIKFLDRWRKFRLYEQCTESYASNAWSRRRPVTLSQSQRLTASRSRSQRRPTTLSWSWRRPSGAIDALEAVKSQEGASSPLCTTI